MMDIIRIADTLEHRLPAKDSSFVIRQRMRNACPTAMLRGLLNACPMTIAFAVLNDATDFAYWPVRVLGHTSTAFAP
jgi:hypothetical protein